MICSHAFFKLVDIFICKLSLKSNMKELIAFLITYFWKYSPKKIKKQKTCIQKAKLKLINKKN